MSDNVLLQRLDPSAQDYYGNIFINPLAEKTLQREDLAIIPTSVFAEKSAGSPLSKFNVAPKHSIGIVSHKRGNGTVLSQHIALSEAYGPTGPLDLASAEIEWMFGDGGTSTGNNVDHRYSAAGLFVVKCLVRIPGQKTFECERTIAVGY